MSVSYENGKVLSKLSPRTQNPEVITAGETMIRLSPRFPEHLARASSFQVEFAGTESNFAVTLQQLGIQTGWISRLPDDVLGRRLTEELRRYNVDVSTVRLDPDHPLGVLFYQRSPAPRSDFVIYNRKGSAASHLTVEDIDWNYVAASRHVHLTGITMALSETCREVVEALARFAKDRGMSLSFDVNYREKLWPPQTAREVTAPVIGCSDLVLITQADAAKVFHVTGTPEYACKRLREQLGARIVCLTLGGEGSLVFDGERYYKGRGYEVVTVDKLGAGDAFSAGMVYGFLHDDLELGVACAGALAALKLTFPGDLNFFSVEDLGRLIHEKKGKGAWVER